MKRICKTPKDIVILDEGNLEDVNGGFVLVFGGCFSCNGNCPCPDEGVLSRISNPADRVINPGIPF